MLQRELKDVESTSREELEAKLTRHDTEVVPAVRARVAACEEDVAVARRVVEAARARCNQVRDENSAQLNAVRNIVLVQSRLDQRMRGACAAHGLGKALDVQGFLEAVENRLNEVSNQLDMAQMTVGELTGVYDEAVAKQSSHADLVSRARDQVKRLEEDARGRGAEVQEANSKAEVKLRSVLKDGAMLEGALFLYGSMKDKSIAKNKCQICRRDFKHGTSELAVFTQNLDSLMAKIPALLEDSKTKQVELTSGMQAVSLEDTPELVAAKQELARLEAESSLASSEVQRVRTELEEARREVMRLCQSDERPALTSSREAVVADDRELKVLRAADVSSASVQVLLDRAEGEYQAAVKKVDAAMASLDQVSTLSF
jgi:hypothetical protein